MSSDTGALSSKYSKLPDRPAHNGGLYTGEPFMKDAPWRNFPTRPETGNMIFNNLRRMNNPPREALYHFPGGGIRPGNNTPELPVEYMDTVRSSHINHMCIPDTVAYVSPEKTPNFRGHTYL